MDKVIYSGAFMLTYC